MTNVWVHDPAIDRDVAAIFDPFGNAVHTALEFDVLGEDVLITGAGPIGLMAGAVVRHAGARHVVVTDVNPYRLELARKMGATLAVDVRDADRRRRSAAARHEGGLRRRARDVAAMPQAFHDMLANMAHGGKIAMLGIPEELFAIDWNAVIFNMLTIRGIYGREMYETWYMMTVMLQCGLDISPVITHRFPAAAFEEAFDAMPHRRDRQGAAALERTQWMTDVSRSARRGARSRSARPALEKPERVLTSPQQAHVDVRGDDRAVLNMCANNYLGLADHPEVVAAAHEALDRWGLRHGVRAVHLRHAGAAQGARRRLIEIPGHRGHDPVSVVLRRERRAVRDAAGAGRRGHLRRAEPREHHRRHPPLQGAAPALSEQRHGRPGSAAEGGGATLADA